MTYERSKRHHYIPKFLIKNWVNRLGTVWVFNQRAQTIFKASADNVFVENNRFTIQQDFNSRKSDEIEKLLAEQERLVAPVIKMIVELARRKCPIRLSQAQVIICLEFLVSITRRTPESVAKMFSDRDELFFTAVRLLPHSEEFDWEDPCIRDDPNVKELIALATGNSVASFAAGQRREHQLQVQEFVRECGLQVVVIQNPSRSFLLGSYGYIDEQTQTKDKYISSADWFPVAPDVVLAFTNSADYLKVSYFEEDEYEENFVHKVNAVIASSSDFVVAKNEMLLVEMYKVEKV